MATSMRRQRRELARAEGGIVEIAEANRDVGAFRDQVLPRIDDRISTRSSGCIARNFGSRGMISRVP